MSDRRIYSILAMAGVTPFVASAILPLAGIKSIEPLGPLALIAASYGLAIVSFLTGIHWATQIYDRQQTSFNLLIASNVVFVAVWLAYVVGSIAVALGTQLAALLVLLGIDRWLMNNGVITPHYYRTRSAATILAALSLATLIVTL
jgi:ABC-type multidrug transport system permease subunit